MTPFIIEKPSIMLRQADDKLQPRQHLFIISDETQDSYETAFKVPGWDLAKRKSGKKKVTYGHPSASSLEPNHIIGIGEERIENMALYSLLTLEPPEAQNRIADTLDVKLNFGSITDASIRAYILDGRQGEESQGENPKIFYFTRQILIDWGVVPDGSNPNAVKQRSDLADFIRSKVPHNRHREIELLRATMVRYYIM